MLRHARVDAPGALHHTIIRGIERRAIVRDDRDRENLLERLSALLTEPRTPCIELIKRAKRILERPTAELVN